MAAEEYNCPSCGAPLSVAHRFTKVVICEYCGQASHVSDAGLDPSGAKTPLVDFASILSVGATGSISGATFCVLGQLRYKYDGGFWDEWFLSVENGKKLWLQEDEGEFTAFEKQTLTCPVPPWSDVGVGSMLTVNELSVFITEKSDAIIAGGKGELSFSVVPGEKIQCVDGNAAGRLVSIEYTPNEINLSIGDEIPIEQILVHD